MSAFEARHISPNVKKAIFKKIEALNKLGLGGNKSGLDIKAGDTINATPSFSEDILEPKAIDGLEQTNALSYQLARNTFARLSVDIPVNEADDPVVLSFASYITPKKDILKSEADGKKVSNINRFGSTTQMDTPLAFNKSPMTNDKTFIWRGHTGITSVAVTQKTFFIKEIQVGWECPDPIDFEERVLPFFLQHGRFMVVEFGWGLDSQLESKIPPITENNMTKFFESLQERNDKSVDSYQAEAGILTTYTYSVTEEGGYKGTMTIISRGENVLYTPIQNVSDEEETLPARTFTRATSSASIENAVENTITFRSTINNLEDFITDYVSDVAVGGVETGVVLASKLRRDGEFEVDEPASSSFATFTDEEADKSIGKGFGEIPVEMIGQLSNDYKEGRGYRIQYIFKKGVMKTRFVRITGSGAGGRQDIGNESQTIKLKSSKNTYCSWGWFEDVILNSFFKTTVTTNKFSGKSIPFKEIRSVHTPYRYEIPEQDRDKYKFKKYQESDASETDIVIGDALVPNRCNNNKNLYSLGTDSIILPGQFFPQYNNDSFETLKFDFENEFSNDVRKRFKREQLRNMKKIMNEKTYTEALFGIINSQFKSFGDKNDNYGYIRNMVFSVDYLKSHFENINSVEEGLRSLWSDVAAKYGGFFNFYINQDENNNGRVGIVDGHYLNPTEKNPNLLSNDNIINYEKYIEGKKSLSNPDDMMQFSVFSKDSIISSYGLNLKLTKEAATLALYGAQGKNANGNFVNSSTLYDAGLQRYGALQNAIFPDLKKSEKLTLIQDKSLVDPLIINDFTTPIDDDGVGLDIKEYKKDSILVSDQFADASVGFAQVESISSNIKKIKDEQNEKLTNQKETDKESESSDKSSRYVTQTFDELYSRNYSGGELTDETKKLVLARLNHSDIPSDNSNWSIQKTIIPIDLDLTIDGIGGLKPGNLFRIDFLPETYRKYTYFIIMSINHSITTQGWSTSMNAKMKLDFPKMIKDGLIKTGKEPEPERIDQRTPEQVEAQEKIKETIEYIEEKEDSNLVALGRDGFSHDLALPSAKGGQYWTENEIKKINEFIKSGKFTRGQAIAKVREFQFARPYG